MASCMSLLLVLVVLVIGSSGLQFNAPDDWHNTDDDYLLCPFCKEITRLANEALASNKTFDSIRKQVIEVCYIALDMKKIKGHVVCPGIIDSFGPPILYILDQLVLDPQTICQKLNYCPRDTKNLPERKTFLRQRDNSTKPANTNYRTEERVKEKSSTFSVIQLTDVHVDTNYAVGSPTDCGLFICCHKDYNGTGSAQQFGHFECDIPMKTYDIMLDAINNFEPKPEFVIFTGDFPPHDIWTENWATQLARTEAALSDMKSKLANFRIYPTLGNHECFPESLYYQPHTDFQYLNNKTAEWWQTLFPIPAEQVDNIRYSAYYTVLIKPGLRMLSFNSQYGYSINFYGLLNDRTPAYYEQMKFMENTLHDARANNEKVIILGHVPPGNVGNTFIEYGDFFTDLVSAYADIIVLSTFGHTHTDMFEVVSNPKSHEDAVGVALVAPSVTTDSQINPSFRVYHFDSQTFELQDFDQYFLNITEANAVGKATVRKLYSAKSEYGMPDVSPKSWFDLTNRFKTDDALFLKYVANTHVQNGGKPSCSGSCKKSTICKCQSASLRNYYNCLANQD